MSETYVDSQILAGIITKVLSDASSDDIDNSSVVTGATVTAALDTINTIITSLSSDDIDNSSTIGGVTISDALNILNTTITSLSSDDVINSSTVDGVTVTAALNSLESSKKDTFNENSAFNKDFGTDFDNVARGNHYHGTNLANSFRLYFTNDGSLITGDTVDTGEFANLNYSKVIIGGIYVHTFALNVFNFTTSNFSTTGIIYAYITDSNGVIVNGIDYGYIYSQLVNLVYYEFESGNLISNSFNYVNLVPTGIVTNSISGVRWALYGLNGIPYYVGGSSFSILGFNFTSPL